MNIPWNKVKNCTARFLDYINKIMTTIHKAFDKCWNGFFSLLWNIISTIFRWVFSLLWNIISTIFRWVFSVEGIRVIIMIIISVIVLYFLFTFGKYQTLKLKEVDCYKPPFTGCAVYYCLMENAKGTTEFSKYEYLHNQCILEGDHA